MCCWNTLISWFIDDGNVQTWWCFASHLPFLRKTDCHYYFWIKWGTVTLSRILLQTSQLMNPKTRSLVWLSALLIIMCVRWWSCGGGVRIQDGNVCILITTNCLWKITDFGSSVCNWQHKTHNSKLFSRWRELYRNIDFSLEQPFQAIFLRSSCIQKSLLPVTGILIITNTNGQCP